jgi:hypothetical protein
VDDIASPAPGGTRMQVAGRGSSLYQGALAEANSVALAAMRPGQHTSPTQAAPARRADAARPAGAE